MRFSLVGQSVLSVIDVISSAKLNLEISGKGYKPNVSGVNMEKVEGLFEDFEETVLKG